ncbi:hypothetical protein QQX10_01330 [Demequina sp. SYSU T00039]|uniref:Uncharacterized protein n=1 Tax=Demequina lignilytica TaxID=3051663 RepID=A0AAW7M770_9MICO|nr:MULTISPECIES: hypothetical protein [unclassified Demequina]MDN4486800.1 hypothetical protein [Demequina sp. SYSU T00039]MDN4489484.1 hypothetical protein [Demequina sp. SYSU T00068]
MHQLIANDLYLERRAAGVAAAAELRRSRLEGLDGDGPARRRRFLSDWFGRPARPAAAPGRWGSLGRVGSRLAPRAAWSVSDGDVTI